MSLLRPLRRAAVPALALLLPGLAAAAPRDARPAPAPAIALPAPVTRTLDNGLRVAVFPIHRLPLLQVQLLVPAGSAAVGENAGLASLTGAALRQGTPSRDAIEIARESEAMGATITSATGRDYTLVSGSFLSGDLEAGLELLSDMVLRPSFPLEGIDRLRREAISSLLQKLGNPGSLADQEVWALAFGGHPYASPPEGSLEALASLGVGQVRTFYRDQYRPNRSVLAIAGDVDPDKAFAAVEEAFGTWSGRSAAAAAADTPQASAVRIRIIDRPELSRCEIRVGLPGPARSTADDLPFALANRVLGGSPDARLAPLGAASTFTPLREGGLLSIAATPRSDSAAAVVRGILGELGRFAKQPPSGAELAQARSFFVEVFPLGFETLAGITAQWVAERFYGLPDDFSTAYARYIDAVEPAAVASAVQRWIAPDRAAVVIVGPAERLRPQLEGIGTVEVLGGGGTVAGPPPATPEQRQRGRELVAQALEAHGGKARLEGIRRSRITSEMSLGMGVVPVRGTITILRIEPYRMVLLTDVQGQHTRQVLEGDRAWSEAADDSTGAHRGDSTMVATMREAFISDLPHVLLAASRADADVVDRGREQVDGRDAERIEVALPGEPRRRLLLDTETHRLVALDEPGRSGFGFGARRTYGDYRAVSGVWWPHHEERVVDGQRVVLLDTRSVALNGDIPEALFRIESGSLQR